MLSLQTLLAFSDQLNDEEPQEMIAKRIADDKYLSQMMLRLDSVMKAPHLEAPDVFDDNAYPNINLVAEYLDHQLEDPEQIHYYENACFKSDELLAEVGCCYEILNHRLSVPVQPPKNCRPRLYYIPLNETVSDISDSSENNCKAACLENNSVSESASHSTISGSPNSENILPTPETCPITVSETLKDSESDLKLDLKPEFNPVHFALKQLLAVSVLILVVYSCFNYSRFDISHIISWSENESQNSISLEDELEESIANNISQTIQPGIISSKTIKEMPVVTVDEFKQLKNSSSNNKEKKQNRLSFDSQTSIDFDDFSSTSSIKKQISQNPVQLAASPTENQSTMPNNNLSLPVINQKSFIIPEQNNNIFAR